MCVCVCLVGRGWAGLRQISLHPISLWHPSAHLLSPSILDDNSLLICIPKTLSDLCLPSRCERLENIDNYWQNPKIWAAFHLEYCVYHFILLFAPFMRTRYWLEYLIATAEAEAYMSRVGEVRSVGLLWKWLLLWMEGYVVIACLCTFPNDTDFN